MIMSLEKALYDPWRSFTSMHDAFAGDDPKAWSLLRSGLPIDRYVTERRWT